MIKFVGLGNVHLRDINDRKKKAKQVLWGDWLNVEEETDDGWAKVKWGGKRYWVRQSDYRGERPLEVVFVDVGQGDGCVLITPDLPPKEKVVIIDAGQANNMYRFLAWRFGKLKTEFNFHAAVITHPDSDHYSGFRSFLKQKLFSFHRLYHNGIGERKGKDRLGPSDRSGRYLVDLVATDKQARELYGDSKTHGGFPYPKLMHAALTNGRVGAVEML